MHLAARRPPSPGACARKLNVCRHPDKEELSSVIKDQLHVQLTDPINDVDLIFDSLDDDKSGLVSMDEVSSFHASRLTSSLWREPFVSLLRIYLN